MRRCCAILLLSALTAVTLCGCGGEAGERAFDAVMQEDASLKNQPKNQPENRKYTYCNDTSLYYTDYADGSGELVMRDLETGREVRSRREGICEVIYVDNEWVYYTKETDLEDVITERQVWRMPVRALGGEKGGEASGEVTAEEELLLEEAEGFDDPVGVQCDGTYLVYVTADTYRYRQYNIPERIYEGNGPMEERDDYMGEMYLWKGSVFWQAEEGLIRKELASNRIETIFPENSDGEVWVVPDGVFWEVMDDSGHSEIWRYSGQKDPEKIIDGSEIETLLEEQGMMTCANTKEHAYSVDGMFERDLRLYLQIFVYGWGAVTCENRAVISVELGGEGELQRETGLTQCLVNPPERQEIIEKYTVSGAVEGRSIDEIYRSRGTCVAMTEEFCLMYLENAEEKKNMWACYEFSTGEFKYLTKKDREFFLMYYDRYNTCLEGKIKEDVVDMYPNDWQFICSAMPNNYDL